MSQFLDIVSFNPARMIGGKPLYVAMAQRKEVRKQQLEQIYNGYQMTTPMMPPGAHIMRPAAGGMYPNGAPMFYTGPPGILAGPPIPQAQRHGMVYQQPQQTRGLWRPGSVQGQPGRPYQPAPSFGVNTLFLNFYPFLFIMLFL